MAEFPPTAEQAAIRELYLTGGSLKIRAFAGSGKTSTLKLLADATPNKKIVYVAFNKPIVAEARTKMPKHVFCTTAHSLAWKAIVAGTRFEERLSNSTFPLGSAYAARLGIEPLELELHDGTTKKLSASKLGTLVIRTVEEFCKTADAAPDHTHVPELGGLDPEAKIWQQRNLNWLISQHIAPYVEKAWADLTSANGDLSFEHSHYLKMWQLTNPRIAADVILFDEAQDANPVMVAVVAAQADHAQLVWVGDDYQQIYSFTGAVNALATMPADHESYLTQSFRFGPAVAAVANCVLAELGSEKQLVGFDKIASQVGVVENAQAVLCRTNAGAVKEVLEAQKRGLKAHLVGGGGEVVRFVKAAAELMAGRGTDHPTLMPFATWQEVLDFVAEDERGGELRTLVNLVEDFDAATIIEAFRIEIKPEDADLIVSTAHKAKGLQWDGVRLSGDYREDLRDEDRQSDPAEEWRLLYVALTRAQLYLDVSMVTLLAEMVGDDAHKPVVEPVEEPVKLEMGEQVELALSVVRVNPWTKDGQTKYVTTLKDKGGRQFKWFGSFELVQGAHFTATWKIGREGLFRGELETNISYPEGIEKEARA